MRGLAAVATGALSVALVMAGGSAAHAAPGAAATPAPIEATDLTPGVYESDSVAVNDLGHVIVRIYSGDDTHPQGDYLWTPDGLTRLTWEGRPVGGAAINDADQVLGLSTDANGQRVTVVWTPGKVTAVTIPGDAVAPTAINRRGQFVARATTFSPSGDTARAYYWDGNRLQDLGVAYSLANSPTGTGPSGPFLNDAGQVAGSLVPNGGTPYGPSRGFVWTNGRLTTLPAPAGGSLTVTALNNHGEAAATGTVDAAGTTHAMLWRGERLVDLGTVSGGNSQATAINDLGQVLGTTDDQGTPGRRDDAFVWSGGKAVPLGVPSDYTQAVDINNRGQAVVRTDDYTTNEAHLYVWHQGVLTELVAPSPGSNGTLTGIGDDGFVAGGGLVPFQLVHAIGWDASGA